jgi:hypothetical protein
MLRQQQMAKNHNSIWGGMEKQCGGVFQQRQTNQMTQNRGRNGADERNNGALGLSSSAWPTLQHAKHQQIQNQQYGSGMRAVFLGNNSGRRESTGTGVFLPRPVESRKKPGRINFFHAVFLSLFDLKFCLVTLLCSTFFFQFKILKHLIWLLNIITMEN